MADTEDKVNKAKELIHSVIETECPHNRSCFRRTNSWQAASIPEGQNELKRNQLRELAALNGTLRDDENQACQNCKCPPKFTTLLTWQAAKSVIENTTVRSSAISPRISFAASVATLVM
jgi:hypothetical protein